MLRARVWLLVGVEERVTRHLLLVFFFVEKAGGRGELRSGRNGGDGTKCAWGRGGARAGDRKSVV